MTRNPCHSLLALPYICRKVFKDSLKTAIFKLHEQPWCSDFNFKFTPGFCCTDLVVLTYSEAKDFLSGGHNVRLLSCLRTSHTLIHHLNQYGAVHGPKKEPWMRTATRTWVNLKVIEWVASITFIEPAPPVTGCYGRQVHCRQSLENQAKTWHWFYLF